MIPVNTSSLENAEEYGSFEQDQPTPETSNLSAYPEIGIKNLNKIILKI